MQTVLRILKQAGRLAPRPVRCKHRQPALICLCVIEATDESGPCGLPALSVAHYGEQNGDLMRDPEMMFELGLAGGAHLNAFYYRNDYVGVEQWSPVSSRTTVTPSIPSFIVSTKRFAKLWDMNLRLQGFAEAFERQQHHA